MSSRVGVHNVNDPLFQSMSSDNLMFVAILEKNYDVHVEKCWVQIAEIVSSKNVSSVVRYLNQKLPAPKLQHLKRVKQDKGRFWIALDIIEPEEPLEKIQCPAICLTDVLAGLSGKLGPIIKAEVPNRGPLTRAQFIECSKLWPVNFHPEKNVEKLVSNNVFSDEELQWHQKMMARVLDLSREHGQPSALVSDHSREIVVAEGVDDRKSHPLLHATMAVVEEVAKSQRISSANVESDPEDRIYRGDKNGEKLIASGVAEVYDKCGGGECKAEASCGRDNDGEKPYLCTGWDVFLSREPCPMCAMALVHSRARRVFFAQANSQVGSLVSCCQVQFLKSLNHHYQVFRLR